MQPTPARGRQGRAYRRDELDGLLRDALGALMADGTRFSELSVERIIQAAGVSRSTFYLNHRDKAAMLVALSAESLSRLYGGARRWVAADARPSREDIAVGMREIFDVFAADEAIMRAVAEVSGSDAAVRDAYVSAVHDYARAIARLARRDPRSRVEDPAATGRALAWMTEASVRHLPADARPARRRAAARALADIVFRALFHEPGEP